MINLNEISTEQLLVYAVVIAFSVFMIAVTSCTVHMNTFNPAEAKLITATQNAKLELARQNSAAIERLATAELALLDKLITKSKIDPIAARCAVEGWSESDKPIVCQAVAAGKTPTEEKQ